MRTQTRARRSLFQNNPFDEWQSRPVCAPTRSTRCCFMCRCKQVLLFLFKVCRRAQAMQQARQRAATALNNGLVEDLRRRSAKSGVCVHTGRCCCGCLHHPVDLVRAVGCVVPVASGSSSGGCFIQTRECMICARLHHHSVGHVRRPWGIASAEALSCGL